MAEPRGSQGPNGATPQNEVQAFFTQWGDFYVQQPLPRGLYNPDVLCYRNSALITLLHAPVVVNWFFLHREQECNFDAEPCLACHFRVFFEEYWLHRESNLALHNHIHCLSCSINLKHEKYDEIAQQDMVEYLTDILNGLKGQNTGPGQSNAIEHIFQLELEYRATCQGCQRTKTYPRERDILLRAAIDSKDPKTTTDIESTIHQYLSDQNVVQWTCGICKRNNETLRRCVIRDAPEVLLVQINRFAKDKKKDLIRKLNTVVEFKESLDITKYLEGTPDEKLEYQLYAAVYHRGESISNGHYFTYARGPTGLWSRIDDEKVRKAEFAELTSAQTKSDSVYFLAYLRKSTTDLTRAMVEAGSCEPQIGKDIPLSGVQGAQKSSGLQGTPAQRFVDIQATIAIDSRELDGKVQGGLTLPGTEPLVTLEPRKRVQKAWMKIGMTMGNENLVGLLEGTLKPSQGDPFATFSRPSAETSKSIPSQPLPSQATAQTATGSQAAAAHGTVLQGTVPQEIAPRRAEPKSQLLKIKGPKPPVSSKVSSKRKRDQAEESQDPEGLNEPAPSAKRQKPSHKQKANKGDKPKSTKTKAAGESGADKIGGRKPKGEKAPKKKKEANKAPKTATTRVEPKGPVDEVHKPTKPRQKSIPGVEDPNIQTNTQMADPGRSLEEVRSGDQGGSQMQGQRVTEGYLGEDLAQPPAPPPPTQPPSRAKSQQPPKPPPREGTRKNPRRKGKQ